MPKLSSNYVMLGYLKLATEQYNKRASKPNADSDYYGMPQLTEQQLQRLVGAMYYVLDNYTEQQAFDKA